MKRQNSRRGRRAPADLAEVTPLPSHSPSPCVVDDVEDYYLCTDTDNNHIQQQQHQTNVLLYLEMVWSLAKPQRYLRDARKEIGNQAFQAMNDAAIELDDELARSGGEWIRSRGAWAVTTIRKCVADLKYSREQNSKVTPIKRAAVGES
jgi:hypothetical protein